MTSPERVLVAAGRDAATVRADLQASPLKGDVIVTREADAMSHYSIRQLPATAQIGSSSLDDAVQIARRFARSHGADLWYDDATKVCRLETNRITEWTASGTRNWR